MRLATSYSVITATLGVALMLPGAAFAAEPTALQKAELYQLRPQVRSQVEGRMTGQQSVRGILETMLLNNTSLLFATNRVVAIDFDKGVEVVEGKNGEIKAFPFDIETLEGKS
jgi:hypothetical protein